MTRKVTNLEILFAVLTVASCLTGSKMVELHIFNNTIYTPASAFCFVSTFLVSNIVAHIAGSDEANKCIKQGVFSQIIATVLFFLVGLLPAQNLEVQSAYQRILGTSWILALASITAFVIAQKAQILVFSAVKAKLKPAVSSFISMLASQALDTIIFSLIAFGVGQKMLLTPDGLSMLAHICLTQYVIKVAVCGIASPLFVVGSKN